LHEDFSVPKTTLSSSYYTTVTLDSAQYASDLTVESTGRIEPTAAGAEAVLGENSGVSLTNYGRIVGSTSGYTSGVGVLLTADATNATVTNSGEIGGGSSTSSTTANSGANGVEMDGGGTFYNSGTIYGGNASDGTGGIGLVFVDTLSSSPVINSGSISGGAGSTVGGIGVEMNDGGTLMNGGNGVYGGEGTGTGVGGVGIEMNGGGVLTNTAKIEGGEGYGSAGGTAVEMNGGGTLTNKGDGSSIVGGYGAAGSGGDGVQMNGGGTLTSYRLIAAGNGGDGSGGIGIQMTDGGTLHIYSSVSGGDGLSGGAGVELTGGTLDLGATYNPAYARPEISGGAGGFPSSTGSGSGGDGLDLTNSTATVGLYASVKGGTTYGTGNGGVGVQLSASTLTNAGGTIRGGGSYGTTNGVGVYVDGTSTLMNESSSGGVVGTIYGGEDAASGAAGVVVASGGVLENDGGEIKGGLGNAAGLFSEGTGGDGVVLTASATASSSGTIYGGGIAFAGSGAGGSGVYLDGGGSLSVSAGVIGGGNVDSAKQNGGDGIYAQGTSDATATVTITGGTVQGGYSAYLGGLGVSLGVDSKLTNLGTITGGESYGAGTSTSGGSGLELFGAGASAYNQSGGTIAGGKAEGIADAGSGVFLFGQGSTLKNDGVITGGHAYGSGSASSSGAAGAGAVVGTGTTLNNYGRIIGGTGSDDSASNDGVWIDGGTVNDFGSIASPSGVSGTAVFFGESTGTLVLETGGSLTGGIFAFEQGDAIDFQGSTHTTEGSPSAGTYSVLTPSNGTLSFEGTYTGEQFVFTSIDGGLETQITLEASCYLRGTRIRCEHGERPIESLRVGDRVATLRGTFEPIRWIGRRSYSGWHAKGNLEVLPVLIRAGALADGLPARDLWVSPGHAMYVDGMLIAARDLVNGKSICQEDWIDEVTYFHLEFDRHEILFAEGAASESFIDDDSRQHFDNAAEYWLRYPDARFKPASFCAPRVEEGYELRAIRDRFAARARAVQRSHPLPSIRGRQGARPRVQEDRGVRAVS
jgi:hypothetical protein